MIDLLYGGNIGYETPGRVFDIVARIFKMEQHLAQWVQTLPANMSLRNSREIPSDGHDADLLERYRIILTIRYHNLRILAHRPIVVRFLDMCRKVECDEQELALLQQIGSSSVHICVKSSLEIVSIVNTIVHSTGMRRNFLGAWWFSLYYSMRSTICFRKLSTDRKQPSTPRLSYLRACLLPRRADSQIPLLNCH